MSKTTVFTIGSRVSCRDGDCGELRRVVVDPVARSLTHLVVEPKYRQGIGRLVPIDLVDSPATGIRLRCTKSEFDALERAEETQFLPATNEQVGYQQEHVLAWPYYGLGMGLGMGARPETLTYDRVPLGEVEVRRGDHVHATDGPIGRVRGLVVDRSDHQVTHVLLDEGHLWGHKRVAIPITAVTSVDDGVRLALTKDAVRDLPAVDLDNEE